MRFEVANQPRFLTFSCYQRLPLFSNNLIKDAFVERLNAARAKTHFRLLGWVIMPEHVHLMVVPHLPEFPMRRVLNEIKSKFALEVLDRWKGLNAPILRRLMSADGALHFWQLGGGYDRNIRDDPELFEKIEYMHENPRRRGLVEIPLDWV